jgi:hypothetical protein
MPFKKKWIDALHTEISDINNAISELETNKKACEEMLDFLKPCPKCNGMEEVRVFDCRESYFELCPKCKGVVK